MESYIENKKVLGTSIIDTYKTPGGSDMVKVMFEDGSEEVMPKLRFELISTPEVSDASSVQRKVFEKVGSVLYSVLHEYGVRFGEVDGALDNCANLLNSGFAKAKEILFKSEQGKLSLIEINNILLKNAKESDNGSGSTGSGTDSENKK